MKLNVYHLVMILAFLLISSSCTQSKLEVNARNGQAQEPQNPPSQPPIEIENSVEERAVDEPLRDEVEKKSESPPENLDEIQEQSNQNITAGKESSSSGSSNSPTASDTLSVPELNLTPGRYYSDQSLELSSQNSEADIFYSLDGSAPSINYTGPITLTEGVWTLRAIAKLGQVSSNEVNENFAVSIPQITLKSPISSPSKNARPVFNITLSSGDFLDGETIELKEGSDCNGVSLGSSSVGLSGSSEEDISFSNAIQNIYVELQVSVQVANAISQGCSTTSVNYVYSKYCLADEIASPGFDYGSGTPEAPYIICSVGELQAMNNDLDAHYELGMDIDASATSGWSGGFTGNGFIPIGRCGSGAVYLCNVGTPAPFTGSFNGNGFTISDLFIDRTRETIGLFGLAGLSAVITNVKFSSADISGNTSKYTGGVVGHLMGRLEGILMNGSVDSNSSFGLGGVVGNLAYSVGRELELSVDSTVSGNQDVGGIAGNVVGSHLFGLKSKGTVTSTNRNVGGMFGEAITTYSADLRSYANVTGNANFVGGIAGDSRDLNLLRVYSSGTITGVDFVGGILGDTYATVIEDLRNKNTVIGVNNVGGVFGGAYYGNLERAIAENNVSGNDKVGGIVGNDESNNLWRTLDAGTITDLDAPTTSNDVGGFVGIEDGSSGYLLSYWYDNPNDLLGPGSCKIPSCNEVATENKSDLFDTNAFPMYDDDWDFIGLDGNGALSIWNSQENSFPVLNYETNSPDFVGQGTRESPYLIGTVAEFKKIGDNPQYRYAFFELTQNLDFSSEDETAFEMIGGSSTQTAFRGHFDGKGFALENVKIKDNSNFNVGVFSTAIGATIKNLKLDSLSISTDRSNVGALVGNCDQCFITNVAVYVNILTNREGIVSDSKYGGIVGFLSESTLSGSYAKIKIHDAGNNKDIASVGGLVGHGRRIKISNSYAFGTININANHNAGGLIGNYLGSNGSLAQKISNGDPIRSSFASVSIFVDDLASAPDIGGIGGEDQTTANDFTNDFFEIYWVNLSGSDQVTACHNNNQNTDCETVVSAESALYVKSHPVYTNGKGWNFDDVWFEQTGGLPVLRMFGLDQSGSDVGADLSP